MSDTERRAFLELELGAMQQLYNGEKTRRETVRNSMAIPFASVTLIILALGTLGRLVPDLSTSGVNMAISVALLLAGLGTVLLIWALVVLFTIDYATLDADGLLLDLSRQAASVEADLDDVIDHPDIRQADAEFVAIQGAIYSYDRSFDSLRLSNDANLAKQGQSLRCLLAAAGLFFMGIVVSLTDSVLHIGKSSPATLASASPLHSGTEPRSVPESADEVEDVLNDPLEEDSAIKTGRHDNIRDPDHTGVDE